MLATTGDDGALRVWDPGHGRRAARDPAPVTRRPGRRRVGAVVQPRRDRGGRGLARTWCASSTSRRGDGRRDPTTTLPAPPSARTGSGSPSDGDGATATVVDATTGKVLFSARRRTATGSATSRGARTAGGSPPRSRRRDGPPIWDASHRGAPRSRSPATRAVVWELDWSPDGTRLATAGDDGTARVSEITEDGSARCSPSRRRRRARWWLGGVAFSPDGQR